ncbi:aminoglycoside phosphotransferase family protein [Yinghuangia sp. ASG 101]|uniref:aminoglycoside phosphotransferase family protein n=1 Tax=Yinghuangia sp. ASG 101 TaxID=2896848 RepID=UPI001E472AD5|nr:aminoglycoside phosphotransferase family protein [Yinghuangia sp. ASG 101]UGQ09238.1 aminoglycoside phosphotransferase family protein [Yinghuangia sp. ASG 101]
MDTPEITEAVVRALLRAQQPDLVGLPIHGAVTGWDNQMWRLGEELAVRLPRTPRGPELLRGEHRWLPALAPCLPLPVPTPLRLGEPSADFPKPWSVVVWVPGEPGDRAPVTRGEHAADALAGFLTALHTQAVPEDAPVNAVRGVPLGTHERYFDEKFRELAVELPDGVGDIWKDAVAADPWDAPPVWLHGDLHPANVVVTDGTLSGVIDFGELCTGDPATDLAAAWLLLPSGARARFFATYGNPDPATIRRARGWAVVQSLSLITVGRAGEKGLPGGKVTWGRAGRLAIDRVLTAS